MIEKYLSCEYVDMGREYPRFDCYGLVRWVRHYEFNKPLMPLLATQRADDKRMATRNAAEIAPTLTRCDIKQGAIAAGYKRSVCAHIGIVVSVDGRRMILEAVNERLGMRLRNIPQFEKEFTRVEYYD